MSLLQKLKFKRNDIFIGFRNSTGKWLDAYVINVEKRDESMFSTEVIDTFKKLGTYENFTSLHAPIKIGEEVVGLLCLENFSARLFLKNHKI
ncbi:MAG: hypothetical protein J7L15_02780 [Clostridiales bacterium]|nr:hypothetical protein [Clostridiales bacterium]